MIDGLAVLLGQIGAADAHVDDRDAERARLVVELLAHLLRQLRALVAHHLDEKGFAEHPAQRRDQQGGEPRVGRLDRAHRLVEFQRILDPVACEGVHHEALLVGRDHLLGG